MTEPEQSLNELNYVPGDKEIIKILDQRAHIELFFHILSGLLNSFLIASNLQRHINAKRV